MRAYLAIDKQKCTGCRLCEFICSYAHKNVYNPSRSRIRTFRSGVLDFSTRACLHCPKPVCIPACPEQAISKIDGKVIIDESTCTGCGACMEVCSRVFMDEADKKAVICDLCDACVSMCPEEALVIKKRSSS
jgi:Fe-S-cluster-containing hydrogenase component 2